uniref:RGS domain-containing protein n=1 Tax=Steinernema glaseri TaxID=37863 RepID=A0A1I7ZWN6_9BILA
MYPQHAQKDRFYLRLEEFKAHFRHHVFANLKQLYANHQRVKELERNETKVLQELTEDVTPLERPLEVAGMHFIQSQSIMSKWLGSFLKMHSDWRENNTEPVSFSLKDNEEIISKRRVMKECKVEVHQQILALFFQSLAVHIVEGISPMGSGNDSSYEDTFLSNMRGQIEVQFPESARFPEIWEDIETYFYDELFDHLSGIPETTYKELTRKPHAIYELATYYQNHIDVIFSEKEVESLAVHIVEGISPMGSGNDSSYEDTFLSNMRGQIEVQFPESARFPEIWDEIETYFYDELFDHLSGIPETTYKELIRKPHAIYELATYYQNHIDVIFSEKGVEKTRMEATMKLPHFAYIVTLVALTFTAGFVVGHIASKFYQTEKLFAFMRFGQNEEPRDVVLFGKEDRSIAESQDNDVYIHF